ncbi:MAG: amidohydrolase [Candidatus Angelobacter sp.]|jgi:amidohydrolase|nr:amidohydrolase [Candidatus Angelobacter sp.]
MLQRLCVILLSVAVCFSMPASAQTKKASPKSVSDSVSTSREKQIAAAADAMRDRLVAQRRDFHMHPELSNREQRTSRVVAERLKAIGFTDVRTGVGKYGVVAVLKGGKPGPVVAVRADMDALPITEVNDVPYKSQNPGVKHACGHDVHTTVELGVAEVLFAMREHIPGSVKFIFQPAEEGPPEGEEGGARLMVKEGALENPRPQAIFGLHVNPLVEVGKLTYTPGPMMASSDTFSLAIHGKQAHGAHPELAVDAIVVAAQAIEALQTIRSRRFAGTDAFVLTVGTIAGGTRNNIITGEVMMEGTVRTLNEDVRKRVPGIMNEVLKGVTEANGASYDLKFRNPYSVTFNQPKLVEETLPTMRRVVGDENLLPAPPEMGSEDFSEFAQVVPGFYYRLGVGNKAKGITAGVHTPDFDADEDSLVIGVKAMSNVLLDYLERHATQTTTSK